MKKLLSVFLILGLALPVLSGCQSTIASSWEAEQEKKVFDFDLSDIYSEETGFHFPGISWGETFADYQAKFDYPVTELLNYGDDEKKVYEADDLRMKIFDRVTNSGALSCDGNDVCTEISVAFDTNGKESELSQDEMKEKLETYLREKFGEPADTEKTEQEVGKEMANTVTYVWKASAADGKKTEMHLGVMYLPYAGEPSCLSLGFLWTPAETGK